MPDLASHHVRLLRLTRTDPEPRVRHRLDGLLLVADGMAIARAARTLHTSDGRLRAWRQRFLAHGRAGLADRPRPGRPPKLDAAAHRLQERALARAPLDDGDPVTLRTVADPTDRLGRRGWRARPATVSRTLRGLGPGDRRSRHAPTHRQDAEAVASSTHAPAESRKRGALAGAGFRLLAVDACDLRIHHHPAQVWQRRTGRPPAIRLVLNVCEAA
jgi:transposase